MQPHHQNDAAGLLEPSPGYGSFGSVSLIAGLMTLPCSVAYGISALIYIAMQPETRRCGVREISSSQGIPVSFLEKILQTLRRYGLLRSARGTGGGYQLARPAHTISLIEVVDILGTKADRQECLLRRHDCTQDNPCPLHYRWADLKQQFLERLENTTVADLVLDQRGPLPARLP